MGGIDIEVPGFKNQDGFLAELSFDAAAPSSSFSVSIFFFNISCAGTAPEGRGRTGDIKKGLLYWFITTVAQQCMIPRRRSSLSGLVVAFLDDPIVIPNYPYQDHEQDHPDK